MPKKYRSAKTGKYVGKKYAEKNPDTTVGEKVTRSTKSKTMPKKATTKKVAKKATKKTVAKVEEKKDGKTSYWVVAADCIYAGSVVLLAGFIIGFSYAIGHYFGEVFINLH